VKLDDELCLCFHVTKRKVINFLRIEKPRRVGQLGECFGAGTGCGWCRPYLQKLFDNAQQRADSTSDTSDADLPDRDRYAAMRARYIHSGGGTPPSDAMPDEPPKVDE